NLTGFETFFADKRPFFVEGADLFGFGSSRPFNNFSVPTIFNSRRIGRAPQLGLSGPNTDSPTSTTIAGAAKLTGRTAKGWSVGVLDAITTRETADFINGSGDKDEVGVEPLTHYFTGRLRRDLRSGNTSVGALVTAVDGDIQAEPIKGVLRSAAYVGGLDCGHGGSNRRWAFDADVTGSRIQGTQAAITRAQMQSNRYLQRPDHGDYFRFDPTRTSLEGYGLDASLTKTSGNHWLGSLAYVTRSPGYESNDLGFNTRSDYHGFSQIVLFTQNQPWG